MYPQFTPGAVARQERGTPIALVDLLQIEPRLERLIAAAARLRPGSPDARDSIFVELDRVLEVIEAKIGAPVDRDLTRFELFHHRAPARARIAETRRRRKLSRRWMGGADRVA